MMAKKIDLENFPTSQSAQNMLATVTPGFYDQSYVGKWLYQVMGLEFDEAERLIAEELPLQFFPETATWGLMYHELKWGCLCATISPMTSAGSSSTRSATNVHR